MSTINYVTRIEFADGEIRRLPGHLEALGLRCPLVATDPGLVASGLVARVVDLLPRGAIVFDQTPANPTEAAVREAHALYVDRGCDGVIGLGGGSSLDLAKAIRLRTGHDGPLSDYAAVVGGLRGSTAASAP